MTTTTRISICMLFIVFSACHHNSIPVGDTSRNSLDWQGTYHGILPCADCPGILTTIQLNGDNTYVMYITYLERYGSARQQSGVFSWDRSESKITLQVPGTTAKPVYQVGENKLIVMALDGSPITSALADHYVLTKDNGDITNKYWKLTSINGEKVVWNQNPGREPHIILRSFDNTVNGSGGCNSMRGTFELTGNHGITFSQVATTKMACMESMEVEDRMLKALAEARRYEVAGDSLFLFDAGRVKSAAFTVVYLR